MMACDAGERTGEEEEGRRIPPAPNYSMDLVISSLFGYSKMPKVTKQDKAILECVLVVWMGDATLTSGMSTV